jgi:hypothetical protein
MYINETDSETPKIKDYQKRKVKGSWESKWFFDRTETKEKWLRNSAAAVVIVPKNTIYKEFSIK